MASFVYGRGALRLLRGNTETTPIDFLGDTIKVGLSNSTHVPNKDDTFLDDAGADDFIDGELSGTGYSRQTLGSKTFAYNAGSDRVELDAADTTWTGINAGTAAQAMVEKDTGVNTTSPCLFNVDTGGFPVVTNGGDLTIQWNVAGIANLTV